MKINSISAREYTDSAFNNAKYIFNENYISDALYIDLNKKIVFAVSYKDIELPIISYLFKDYEIVNFFESLNSSSLLIIDKKIKLIDHLNKEIKIDVGIAGKINDSIKAFNNYGGVLNEFGDHIIDLKSKDIGPHFTTNLLLGNRFDYKEPLLTTPKSVVNAFGGGSFRSIAGYQVLATRWDIRPEENGNPYNRQFYILEDNKEIFYSGMVDDSIVEAKCIHSNNMTTIIYETKDLKIRRNIFIIPQEKGLPIATECQTIDVLNLLPTKRNLSIIVTGMFGLSNPECQMVDIIYQTVITQSRLLKDDKGNTIGVIPDYYPRYFKDNMRFAILKDDQGYLDSYTQDSTEFLSGGDIAHPNGLLSFKNEPRMTGSSFFAIKKNFVLYKNDEHSFDEFVGATNIEKEKDIYVKTEKEVGKLLVRFNKHNKVLNELKKVEDSFDSYKKYLQIKSDDKVFDSYVNNNLPYQVLYQTFVSRSFAQTQKGYREIGFREIQDIYASMYYLVSMGKNELVESLLTKWIENVYEFGYANHNFYFKGKEPGMCSDDQLWLVQAVYRYVTLTGKYSFLDEEFKMAGKNKKRKLIDTLKAIIAYSAKISVGKHNIPLLDCADWNDCLRIDDDYLDGPHKEKQYKRFLIKNHQYFGSRFDTTYSESIMNGFLLIIAEKELKELVQDEASKVELDHLIGVENDTMQKNAYINDYFVRVLINKETKNHNKYIGSKGDGLSIDPNVDGSYYLNSFSWSLLSDVAKEDQIKKMLDIVDKVLKTEAGYMLCSKHNLSLAGSKQASTDHYFVGDRENGGVFKHATMMMTVAMLSKSKEVKDKKLREQLIDDSYYMLDRVLPYKTLENPFVLKGNPRFCTQYNNSITCENIGPILSGTASWLTLAIYEIVGLKFLNGQIEIKPVLSKDMQELQANLALQEMNLTIKIHKNKGSYGDLSKANILLDGKKSSFIIPIFKDKKNHVFEITY